MWSRRDRHRAPNGSACNPKTCTSALWDGAREWRWSSPEREGADTRCGSRGCRSASRSQDFFSGDSPIDYRGLGWSRISRAVDCAARVRTLIASQRYRADPCAKRRHVHPHSLSRSRCLAALPRRVRIHPTSRFHQGLSCSFASAAYTAVFSTFSGSAAGSKS